MIALGLINLLRRMNGLPALTITEEDLYDPRDGQKLEA
jgi:hypothetical protein